MIQYKKISELGGLRLTGRQYAELNELVGNPIGTKYNPLSLVQWRNNYIKALNEKRFWKPLRKNLDDIQLSWLKLKNAISKSNGNN